MHNSMTNLELAELLRDVSAVYQLEDNDRNRFRIDAYDRAATAIEHLSSEAKDMYDEGKLAEIPGVGSSIAKYLSDIFKKGKSSHFASLLDKYPPAMFEFMKIPGIGPKTAYKLSIDLKIKNKKDAIGKLKEAIEQGKVAKIEGLGEQSASAFQKGITEAQGREKRMLLPYALEVANEIIEWLCQEQSVLKTEVLGSLRRRASTVGDIDIAVATKDPIKAISKFTQYKNSKRTLDQGKKSASILLPGDIRVDLKTVNPKDWGSMLQHFTGSKQHNIALREMALKKNLSLSEYGIKAVKSKKAVRQHFDTEENFYHFLDLTFIPPEIREEMGELEAAKKGKIPKLLTFEDITADLHMHSDFNIETSHDLGMNTMEEHIKKANTLGYTYIAFTEHNPSHSKHSQSEIAALLTKKRNKVDQLNSALKNSKYSCKKVFNSLEIDILPDGSLPVPPKGLETLDFALVSLHSSFNQDRKTATKRVLSALSQPKVKVFAHPTARLLQRREGVELNWEEIFAFCVKNNKWLEINADPSRLDLPDFLIHQAIKKGVKLTLGTDSHTVESMDNMKFGVWTARRGWAVKRDIINTLKLSEFEKEVKEE